MLVTKNFSISHNLFKSPLFSTHSDLQKEKIELEMKMKPFTEILRLLLGCCSSGVDQDKETGKTEMPYIDILLSKWLDQLDKFLSPDFNVCFSNTTVFKGRS